MKKVYSFVNHFASIIFAIYGKYGYGIVGDDPFNDVEHHFENKPYIFIREFDRNSRSTSVLKLISREKFINECLNGVNVTDPKEERIQLSEEILVIRADKLVKTQTLLPGDRPFDEWASSAEGLAKLKEFYIRHSGELK